MFVMNIESLISYGYHDGHGAEAEAGEAPGKIFLPRCGELLGPQERRLVFASYGHVWEGHEKL